MSTKLTKKSETSKWDFDGRGIRCKHISLCGYKLGLSAIFYWYLLKRASKFSLAKP